MFNTLIVILQVNVLPINSDIIIHMLYHIPPNPKVGFLPVKYVTAPVHLPSNKRAIEPFSNENCLKILHQRKNSKSADAY